MYKRQPPGSGWSHDPFDMVEKDGRVYGRGVNDNKGAAAMALYAMKFLQESGLPLKPVSYTHLPRGCPAPPPGR